MNLHEPRKIKGLAPLFLISIVVFAGACSTDSGSRRSTSSDPSDETRYLSPAEARKDPDRIICRRHQPTGSRISEKICMTAKQWQATSDAAEEMLEKAQRAPQGNPDQ